MRRWLCLWSVNLFSFLLLAGGRGAASFLTGRSIPASPAFVPSVCSKTSCLCSYSDKNHPEPDDERTVVLLYHKPPNVITSHSNADAVPNDSNVKQRRTVYQDIETLKGYAGSTGVRSLTDIGIHSKLHAIGRLDADTTGLLLLTNDGGLVHHVTNPNSQQASITKTYEAVIMGYWNDASPELQDMRLNGVDIGSKYGGRTRPPKSLLVLDHPSSKSTRVEITISEGKNRQVRRMFHAIGSGVMPLGLHRTRIGDNLILGDLQQGQWRILTDEEVETSLNWKPRVLEKSTPKKKHVSRRSSRRGSAKRRQRVSSSSRPKRRS